MVEVQSVDDLDRGWMGRMENMVWRWKSSREPFHFKLLLFFPTNMQSPKDNIAIHVSGLQKRGPNV